MTTIAIRRCIDYGSVGIKSPTFSLRLRWFTAILKHLMCNSWKSTVIDGCKGFWLAAFDILMYSLPFDLSENTFWELLAIHRQPFQGSLLDNMAIMSRTLVPVHPKDISPSSHWMDERSWAASLHWSFKIILIGFLNIFQEYVCNDTSYYLLKPALEDARNKSPTLRARRSTLLFFLGSQWDQINTSKHKRVLITNYLLAQCCFVSIVCSRLDYCLHSFWMLLRLSKRQHPLRSFN